jgi:FkbH-like protein
MMFQELKNNLTRDFSSFPELRLALLGDSATQFLSKAIKGYGYFERLKLETFEADFDQMDRQILDSGSELYRSKSKFIVLYPCAEKLWERFVASGTGAKPNFHSLILEEIKAWWRNIALHSGAKVIQFNLIEINDGVFGHFASKTTMSFPYQIKKLNLELMDAARAAGDVFIVDVASLANSIGQSNAHDSRLYAASKIALAPDFLPAVAKGVVDVLKAINGNVRKCLVLDLDNTLWGGVVGDDGIENIQIGELGMGRSYNMLQTWAKALKDRGIVLAVCSKNDEEIAKLPFRKHPDMRLRLDDIALFIANWDNKVDNLKLIQRTLNIGFDSMVFVDDSPFERNMVREFLPMVTVPDLPEDPAMYVPYLRSLNLFELASFSQEDMQRTSQYQQDRTRADFEKTFTSIDDYLRSLEMASTVQAFNDFSVPRVAQLTQRSNQFNLRTFRYTEADIDRLRKSEEFITLSFELRDKFGNHGLVGVAILKQLSTEEAFIDTWIMSCRVLKRGMEEFMLNYMAKQAQQRGTRYLMGEYLPTAKNAIVGDLYGRMGFEPCDGRWELDLQLFKARKTFIREA